ncbi:hypothetical protein EV368DRAFT_89924 [Lentinula lateritia]|nr:hypothetical protein EV368DRAFT_89924 [Lentinula lateritia]
MSAPNRRSRSRTRSPPLPVFTTLGKVPSPGLESDGEVEQDQLAFTIEFPSRPQLQLFETVFNTGKPLSGYSGPSSKRVRSDASKKRSRRRSPEEDAVQESPLRVRLVVPPGRSVAASTSTLLPPRASPSLMEVPGGDLPVQGHSSLVRKLSPVWFSDPLLPPL